MNICECGCNQEVKPGKRFINHHCRRGVKLSQETKNKMHSKAMGNKSALGHHLTADAKDRMRQASIGNKSALGYHHTIDAKHRIGQASIGKKYALGHKQTPEHKRRIGQANMGKKRSAETKHLISQAGIGRKQTPGHIEKKFRNRNGHKNFEYINGMLIIKMRSSWEVLYAKYLDSLNLIWEYESKGFITDFGLYFPDFYLPELNEYREVKGYMTEIAQNKINSFRAKYSFKLQIIGKEIIESIKIGKLT